MARLLALIVLITASTPALEAQAPGGKPTRAVTVLLAGPALSGGAAQEALQLGIPWGDFADQLYPRQNVTVQLQYYWRPDKIVDLESDVRKRGFDYDRAKFLLSRAGFFERRPNFVLVADFGRPEFKRGVYWLRDQLRRLDLYVDDSIRDYSSFNLEQEKADAIVIVR
jgi:hypothetical protein